MGTLDWIVIGVFFIALIGIIWPLQRLCGQSGLAFARKDRWHR